MRINLEINEYHTATQLIFYENDVSLLQAAFDNTTCDRSSEYKQNKNKKRNCPCYINRFWCWPINLTDLKKGKKIF